MAEVTLAAFQESGLPPAEMIGGRLGYIHDLFLTFDYEVVGELPDEERDLVAIVDNKATESKLERLAAHRGRVVVVLAGSDGSFRSELLPNRRVLPANFAALFTINNEVSDGRIVNLPLGVRIKKLERVREARRVRAGPPDRLLYGNFSVSGLYPADGHGKAPVRQRLAEQFGDAPWADMDLAEGGRGSDADLLAYYANIARHRFVLSPEGFGADCYRHWECLYLGAIPIVRTNPAMLSFADLPILFTEDYSEIDEAYLEEQWARLSAQHFELERLTASFYRARFERCIARLSSPRFLCWGFRGTDDERFLDRLPGSANS
jgi:hypothetical protein